MSIHQSDLKPSWRNKPTIVYKSVAIILFVFSFIIAPVIILIREKDQLAEYFQEVKDIWRIK